MAFLTAQQLTGRDESYLDRGSLYFAIHPQVVDSYKHLKEDAAKAGIDLAIASGYRSFERQCQIWNGKASGERPVLDEQGQPIEIKPLDGWQLAQAILRWSALPGTSRHHWGTDLDVYDKAAVADGYQLQLTQAEYEPGGPFEHLNRWLSKQIAHKSAYGFFRPYSRDRGGVAPEPWHLSYAPLARQCQQALSVEDLKPLWAELVLGDVITEHADFIYKTYVAVPWSEYPE